MIKIIQHPAQSNSVNADETFDEYVKRIRRARKEIRFGDGTPIVLEPGKVYSTLMLKMPRLLLTEEFAGLVPYVMGAIKQAEADGVIPADSVESIATAFDITPPVIPQRFFDEDPAAEIAVHFAGLTGFEIVKNYPVEIEPDEEE